MSEDPSKLFRFKKPPVQETVVGIHFERLQGFQSLHPALFWNTLKQTYPEVQEVPPAPQFLEDLSAHPKEVSQVIFGNVPPDKRRWWFLQADQLVLLQLQADFFGVNWRRLESKEEYPGYTDFMRPEFERRWKQLIGFCAEQKLPTPKPLQVEVSYVSFAPKGEGCETLRDVIAPWSGEMSVPDMPPPEGVAVQATYRVPNRAGRLRVVAVPALRPHDNKEGFHFTTTTKIRIEAGNDALEVLDAARWWSVQGFAAFTTPRMHDYWEKA